MSVNYPQLLTNVLMRVYEAEEAIEQKNYGIALEKLQAAKKCVGNSEDSPPLTQP